MFPSYRSQLGVRCSLHLLPRHCSNLLKTVAQASSSVGGALQSMKPDVFKSFSTRKILGFFFFGWIFFGAWFVLFKIPTVNVLLNILGGGFVMIFDML